jgi:enoyl-CoA hydratase/carnithine racemase
MITLFEKESHMNDSIVTQKHGHILEIILNRPETYNALNLDLMVMLSDALSRASCSPVEVKLFAQAAT